MTTYVEHSPFVTIQPSYGLRDILHIEERTNVGGHKPRLAVDHHDAQLQITIREIRELLQASEKTIPPQASIIFETQ